MALLSIFRGTQAECSARPVSDGTLLFATDTKKIYLDKDSSRIEMSSVDDLGNYVTKEQLTTALNGKANTTHTHTQDQITGLKDALAGKASTSHSHSVASSSASGFMSAADKQKLDGIATGANKYTLPVASSAALGGVKIGYKESGKNYSVKLDNNNQAYVTVPWTDTTSKDTNTTYTLTKSGSTITLEGSDGSSTAVNDDNTTYSLGSFGITATAAELNYVDGVTSNIQTQLNSKAASSHNHSAANITSGTLSTDRLPTVPIGRGGTGAGSAADARANLGFNATNLTSENLNGLIGYTETKSFYGGGSNTVKNKPDGVDAFSLTVLRSADGWTSQILVSSDQNPGVYYRSISGSTVQPWKRIYDYNSPLPVANGGTGATDAAQARANIGAAATSHTHTKSQITDFPSSLKNPNSLTISLNGTSQGAYDGSAAKSINVTPSSIGAAASSHNHDASNITSGTLSADRIPTITDGKIQSISASKITGTIPQSILPSYVDDVLEYENLAAFPKTGESGKIYVADDTNKTYRWSGTAYVEISASLALGTTSSTAFRGDYGNTAYAHAQAKGSAFSSGLYKITTNSQGHVTAATAVTKSDITALGIPGSDTNTNTTYSLSKSGSTITLKGSDGSTTSVTDADTNTTYSTFKGATTSAAGGTGLVPAPATGAANRYLRSDGTWQVPPDNNTTYSNMGGASSSAAGHAGLVPAPAAGASNRYLRSDGTWSVPPDNNTNTTYSLSKNGSTITLTGSDGSKTSVTDSNTTYSLSSFGVNASAAELNYVKGVTSSIQTQLNGKAASNHTHNYAGADSAGGAAKEVKNWGNASENVARHVWFSNNGADNQRVYNDNFKYNPVGNTVSCNISGTANFANYLNGTSRYVTQNSVNKPYWRCLKLESAQNWLDSSIILCVDAGYENGGFGILAVRLRNDNVSESAVATHGTVQWLCRYGYEPDQFILKIHSAKATTGYADLYFHATGTYNGCNIRILANSTRGGNGSSWQLMNDEPRAAMDTRAYTAQATGYDVGKVAYASKLATARTISLAGDVTGSANFDGSANISITSNIAAGTVGTNELANSAVTNAKIAADSVSLAKLGSDVGTVAVQSTQPNDTNVKLWIQI